MYNISKRCTCIATTASAYTATASAAQAAATSTAAEAAATEAAEKVKEWFLQTNSTNQNFEQGQAIIRENEAITEILMNTSVCGKLSTTY